MGSPTHTPASVYLLAKAVDALEVFLNGRGVRGTSRHQRYPRFKVVGKYPHVRRDVGSPMRHSDELLNLLHVSLVLLVAHRVDALSDPLQVLVKDR